MKRAAAGLAPAAEASLEAGADAFRSLRVRAGLTQRELALKSGCSPARIAEIDRGEKPPSWKLAERIAAALETDAVALFGAPGVCACCAGCEELTYRTYAEHHASAQARAVARRKQAHELDAFKLAQGGLLTADEVVRRSRPRYSRGTAIDSARKLGAIEYPGPWAGAHKPLLFPPEAPQRLPVLVREANEEGRERTRRAVIAWWRSRPRHADGGTLGTIPRQGVQKLCPCHDCESERALGNTGRVVYLRPSRAGRPGYHSMGAWNAHKWRTERFFVDLRRTLKRKLGGHWDGKKGGRPRLVATNLEIAAKAVEVRSLRASNPKIGERAIAERLDISRRQVRHALGKGH
jgi:transcriptional regulator with XRE-family HTH domain